VCKKAKKVQKGQKVQKCQNGIFKAKPYALKKAKFDLFGFTQGQMATLIKR